jgi:hypothetical protein
MDGSNDGSFEPRRVTLPKLAPLKEITLNTNTGSFSINLAERDARYFNQLFSPLDFSATKIEIKDRFQKLIDADSDFFDSDSLGLSTTSSDKLYFFLLENYSNPELDLTNEERVCAQEEVENYLFYSQFQGGSSDLNKTNAYFALLVYLLSIQEKVESNPTPNNPIKAEHEALLEDAISLYIHSLQINDLSEESSELARDDFENILIANFQTIPQSLIRKVAEILKPEKWASYEMQGERIREESRINLIEVEVANGSQVAFEARKQTELGKKLTRVQEAITPNDSIVLGNKTRFDFWRNPIDNLIEELKEKEVISYAFLESFPASNSTERPTTLDFQINFIKAATSKGFNDLFFSGPFTQSIYFLHNWLKNEGKPISMVKLRKGLEDFLNEKDRIFDLRASICLPNLTEPEHIQHVISFWEDVKSAISNKNTKVTIYNPITENDELIAAWLKGVSPENKKLCMSQGLIIDPSLNTGFIAHLEHADIYDYEEFLVLQSLPYSAFEVSRTSGWGKHSTVCIPTDSNNDLITLSKEEDLPIGEESTISVCEETDKFVDFVLVTFREEGDGGNEKLSEKPSPFEYAPSGGPMVTA